MALIAQALAIEHVSITVPDLDAAERFFADALTFEPLGRRSLGQAETALLGAPASHVTASLLGLGRQRLELLCFDPPGRPAPADATSSDLWFQHCAIVVGDMAAAFAHLGRFGSHPITEGGPQRLPPNTGSVSAFKFRDPFGHPFELLEFPEGVGAPVWHEPNPALFRGIDHTAIAVRDAATSVAFYRDQLGFRPTDHSFNIGVEQSRLDAVAEDRVVVEALQPAAAPPHLELLAYQTGLRRPRPADWTAADVAMARTVIAVEGGEPALIEDPDGHVLMLRPR